MPRNYNTPLPVEVKNTSPIPVTGSFTPSGTQDVRLTASTITLAVSAAQSGAWTVAATQSGVWSTGRTWTLSSASDAVAAVQSGAWSVSVSNFPATQPVSGTVAVSSIASALPAGTNVIGHVITDTGSTIVVSNFPSTQAVTGPLTDTQLRATPVPISGTVTTTPSGTQTVTGTVTVTQATGTNLHAVIDSGTVAATQSGSWNINNISGTVSLPTGAATETTLSTLNSNTAKSYGTWAYYAGTSGTVNVSVGQRVIGITAHATTAGSMTINGGATIPIPANVGIGIEPIGNITAPTIVFSGTDAFFVEAVS